MVLICIITYCFFYYLICQTSFMKFDTYTDFLNYGDFKISSINQVIEGKDSVYISYNYKNVFGSIKERNTIVIRKEKYWMEPLIFKSINKILYGDEKVLITGSSFKGINDYYVAVLFPYNKEIIEHHIVDNCNSNFIRIGNSIVTVIDSKMIDNYVITIDGKEYNINN